MNIIDIQDITKDYGGGRGVFDIAFQVKRGEVLGFLGPNGAGKTTTIRQLMGFLKPDKGKVLILGKDCFKEADQIARFVGYLPGEMCIRDRFLPILRHPDAFKRVMEAMVPYLYPEPQAI